jgi:hypothetical protein
MEIDLMIVVILLIGWGIWWIWDSFHFYTCRLRKVHIYLIEGNRPSYTALSYGLAPLGIGIIVVGIGLGLQLSPDVFGVVLAYLAGPFFAVGFGLLIWQPRWLTPGWLKWIEEYNYDIRSLLGEEARQTLGWTQRIRSQADLEAWVAEVREKHHQPQPLDSYTEALQRAGQKPPSRSLWGVAILIVGIASGLGQLFLGNAFIGFIIGGGVVLVIHLLQSRK